MTARGISKIKQQQQKTLPELPLLFYRTFPLSFFHFGAASLSILYCFAAPPFFSFLTNTSQSSKYDKDAFILVVFGLILNARGEDSCRTATICCEESLRRCGGVCECIRFSQRMTRERVLRVQFAPGTHLVYADRVLVEVVGDPVPRISK